MVYVLLYSQLPRYVWVTARPLLEVAKGQRECPTVQTLSHSKMNWKNLGKWELENAFPLFSQTLMLNSNSMRMTVSVFSGFSCVNDRRKLDNLCSIQNAAHR